MKTLLEKLERIRKELGSDKVFDVIGRLFEGVSIKEYMEQAVTSEGADGRRRRLEGTLTKEQVEALEERERRLYGDGGDVKSSLCRRSGPKLDREGWRRLLPGYVRRFVEKSAPLLGLGIDGDLGRHLRLRQAEARRSRLPLRPLETYPPARRERLTVQPSPGDAESCVFLHPGEPVFDRLRAIVCERFARRGPAGRRVRGPVRDRAVPVPPGARSRSSRQADPQCRPWPARSWWSTASSGCGSPRTARSSSARSSTCCCSRAGHGMPAVGVRAGGQAADVVGAGPAHRAGRRSPVPSPSSAAGTRLATLRRAAGLRVAGLRLPGRGTRRRPGQADTTRPGRATPGRRAN